MDAQLQDPFPKIVQWSIVLITVAATMVYFYFHWPLIEMTIVGIKELLP